MFWTNEFQTWDEDEFKGRLRINRDTFNMIIERMSVFITKKELLIIYSSFMHYDVSGDFLDDDERNYRLILLITL